MTSLIAGWRLTLIAAGLGFLAAFGQEPYGQPLILMAAFVAAVFAFAQVRESRQAALFGWAFGASYFAHALHWIVSPFMVDAARHGWMAPFALVLLASGLALFWGLAFWGARRIDGHRAWPLVLTLPAAEMLRAYIFTGFPWAMPSQALVDPLAGQALAWVGAHALNAAIVLVAVTLGFVARSPLHKTLQYGVILFGLGALILPPMAPDAPLTDQTIRLVQPNAAQHEKWDPQKIPMFFDRQLQFTATTPADGNAPGLILWSETAIPWRLEHAAAPLAEVARAGGSATVALGLQRAEAGRFFNAMVTLGPMGEVTQSYDKHHLVPFGEYVPFAGLLNRIGIFGLAQQMPAGYAAGPGPQLLDFGALGSALPLICYEAVFAQDVNAAPGRPDFLIQITNDAWFGRGAGPRQHLAQARMRAIEQGLPLARAANTGISAMIDPWGRITAALPLNQAGFLDAALPRPLVPTLYSRMGDLPFAIVLLLGLALATLRSLRRERRFND